jgi:hypothetical protein
MDHWGDPWADNANDKSPTKNAVTSPLPRAFSFAPVPFNGFVDDAGWGNNDDDGFGDWATSDVGNVALRDKATSPAKNQVPGSAGWDTVTYEEREASGEKWPENPLSTPRNPENVDSEPSDSATVSQLDEAVSQDTVEEPTQPQLDVETSVRSSTSPSETSRNDLPVESPRTSIEDERSIAKDEVLQNEALVSTAALIVADTEAKSEVRTEEDSKDPADTENTDNLDEHGAGTGDVAEPTSSSADESNEPDIEQRPSSKSDATATVNAPQAQIQSTAFICDRALLDELYPSSDSSNKQLDAHEDPIYSTSARKAWYRLTRKQTLREFNHGENDDNYVRVTWTNSHVRAEVNKVVARWAREDRISGTGPGARASFYWDTPAPIETKAPFGHSRTQSSLPTTKTALPARQSLPPLATDRPAAFDWSSSASGDPWKLESPAQRPISTPLALKNPAVTKIQRQEGRAVSVDLTPRKPEQSLHKRTATVSHTTPETTAVANLISPSISQSSAEASDSWADFSSFDTPSTSTAEAAGPSVDDDDDDDEWGEMVQTPTLPTSQQLDPFSKPSLINNTPPLSSSPKLSPPEPVSAPAEPAEPMSAVPIVRLQSTISPTSALFKANTFVPLHAEQGPIGPDILKPANRSVRSTPDKKPKIDVPEVSSVEKIEAAVTTKNVEDSNDDFTAWAIPEPASQPSKWEDFRASTPVNGNSMSAAQPITPVQASADSWADADFSFLESAPPAIASQPPSQTQDLSDPFSLFDTPVATSTAPASKPFSRSPPRELTPPPLQPLTGATSSVQRRKAEEDQTIIDILSGLPDLSYMLRQ